MYINVHMCMFTCVCMFVCVHVHVHKLYVCVCMHAFVCVSFIHVANVLLSTIIQYKV